MQNRNSQQTLDTARYGLDHIAETNFVSKLSDSKFSWNCKQVQICYPEYLERSRGDFKWVSANFQTWYKGIWSLSE